jgi:hypothetical protein
MEQQRHLEELLSLYTYFDTAQAIGILEHHAYALASFMELMCDYETMEDLKTINEERLARVTHWSIVVKDLLKANFITVISREKRGH